MSEGRTRIERLYQEGAAKIRMPEVQAGDPLEAVLINTAGGLTGGDRIAWEIEVGRRRCRSPSRPRPAKRSTARSGGHAPRSGCRCRRSGARIAWLPQETIVFDRSAFSPAARGRSRRGRRGADRRGDACSAAAPWAKACRQALFRDRWRVRQDGRLIHAEDFAIGPDLAATLARPRRRSAARSPSRPCCSSRRTPKPCLTEVRDIIGEDGGASAWSVGGIWQASCEACRRGRLRAAQAADAAGRPAQWTGRPAQGLVTLGHRNSADHA